MVKHIIFDLGGVLINLNTQATIDAFTHLGVSVKLDAPQLNAFETGELTEAEFYDFIRASQTPNQSSVQPTTQITTQPTNQSTTQITTQSTIQNSNPLLDQPLSNSTIDAAWNKMLLDFPNNRLELLMKLKQAKINLYLLSNTNIIHHRCFEQTLLQQWNTHNFKGIMQGVYYSYQMGLRKPNPEIYNAVLQANSLPPSETLFIDDNHQNILGAQQVGLKTIWLQPGQCITELGLDKVQ